MGHDFFTLFLLANGGQLMDYGNPELKRPNDYGVCPRLFLAQVSYFADISRYCSLVTIGLLISSKRVVSTLSWRASIFPAVQSYQGGVREAAASLVWRWSLVCKSHRRIRNQSSLLGI